jgi:raffinose/stachyose/melibiose transport system substrate-binding protein
MTAAPGTDFGIMNLPISTDAKSYGNDSIPVGVPGYFMIDAKQSTKAQQAGALDFLTWLYTSADGQHFVADPVTKGGMGFIPVYSGFKVQPATFMAREIAKYVAAGKTLEWINTYYPAGLQETVGKVSMQQYFTDKISSADLAKAIQDAWKGSAKTWRGESA